MFQEPAVDRLTSQVAQPVQLGLGVRGPLRGVELEVVALEEDRRPPALSKGGGQDDGGVLGRPLVGVGHLALGDLEDHRPRVALEGRGERLARGEVRGGTHVDRRHGEGGGRHLAAPAGAVQLVDRGRSTAERLRRAPDHPARGVAERDVLVEDGLEDEVVHERAAQGRLVEHGQSGGADVGDAGQPGAQVRIGRDAHDLILPKGRNERECQQGRHDETERGGQQVPVAGRARIGHAARLQAGGPPAHGAQADDVDRGGKRHDRHGERTDVVAVTERQGPAGRARGGELETDEDAGGGNDDRRPGEVPQERGAQRMAGVRPSRAASSASRRVMRWYSK